MRQKNGIFIATLNGVSCATLCFWCFNTYTDISHFIIFSHMLVLMRHSFFTCYSLRLYNIDELQSQHEYFLAGLYSRTLGSSKFSNLGMARGIPRPSFLIEIFYLNDSWEEGSDPWQWQWNLQIKYYEYVLIPLLHM